MTDEPRGPSVENGPFDGDPAQQQQDERKDENRRWWEAGRAAALNTVSVALGLWEEEYGRFHYPILQGKRDAAAWLEYRIKCLLSPDDLPPNSQIERLRGKEKWVHCPTCSDALPADWTRCPVCLTENQNYPGSRREG